MSMDWVPGCRRHMCPKAQLANYCRYSRLPGAGENWSVELTYFNVCRCRFTCEGPDKSRARSGRPSSTPPATGRTTSN